MALTSFLRHFKLSSLDHYLFINETLETHTKETWPCHFHIKIIFIHFDLQNHLMRCLKCLSPLIFSRCLLRHDNYYSDQSTLWNFNKVLVLYGIPLNIFFDYFVTSHFQRLVIIIPWDTSWSCTKRLSVWLLPILDSQFCCSW